MVVCCLPWATRTPAQSGAFRAAAHCALTCVIRGSDRGSRCGAAKQSTAARPHVAMAHHQASGSHASHFPVIAGPELLTAAVVVHTLGHLLVAGLVALVVYEKLGLAILKTAWFNIDFTWALALIATGVILA